MIFTLDSRPRLLVNHGDQGAVVSLKLSHVEGQRGVDLT